MLNTQYVTLSMIPSGVMPVLYCSQYDVGRPLGFVVNNGSEVVNLDQYAVAIEGTRSDGTGIVADVNTDGNIGVFLTTATMTNKSDIYDMQLVIRSTDTYRVASIPFMMNVRTAALDENSSVIEEDKSLFQQYTETVMIALAEIRTDVESEATARSNADSALLEKINIEAADRAAEDTALNDRIDNIIAPGGAPSAAEVTDARLGADGVLYDTLGEAIRTQFDDVYKNLAYTVNLESDPTTGLLVVDGGIGGTVPTSLTATLEPQQSGAGAPSADNIRPFIMFTSLSMLHAGESGGGGSGNPPVTPFFGGTQNCITGEWTLYQYNSSYSGVTDLTGVRWWSDRDVYVAGTNPSVGAYVVYEPSTPMRSSGQAWGAEAMYPGINQYKMLAYDSVTQTQAAFTLNIETDVANVGDVIDGIADDVSTLQSDMDQTNQALTLLRNEYDITASTVVTHTTLIENNTEDIEENTADIAENAQEISLLKSHLEATYITDTVSGAIASFADGADGIPVKSLTVGIGPIQSGTGDPSPENIRPISGRQSVTIIRTGDRNNTGWTRNMSVGEDGSINTGAGSDYYCSPFIPAKTIVYLDIQAMAGGSRYFSIAAYDANKNFIAIVRRGPISATSHRVESYNLPEGTVYVVISFGKGTNGKINYVVGDYDPRYTVQLGDTVYGGSLDVTTGVLTVTYAEYKCSAVDVDGWSLAQSGQDSGSGKYYAIIKKTVATPYGKTANNGDGRGLFNMGEWRYSSNSKWRAYTTTDKQLTFVVIVDTDITTTEALNTFLATLSEPLQACYELATPVTVQLTGQTLTTLKGQNNIWSNAGDVAVDYVADTKLYIEQLTEPDADMIADANITSGQYFMVGNALFLATANIASGASIVPGVNCTRTNLAAALNALNS